MLFLGAYSMPSKERRSKQREKDLKEAAKGTATLQSWIRRPATGEAL